MNNLTQVEFRRKNLKNSKEKLLELGVLDAKDLWVGGTNIRKNQTSRNFNRSRRARRGGFTFPIYSPLSSFRFLIFKEKEIKVLRVKRRKLYVDKVYSSGEIRKVRVRTFLGKRIDVNLNKMFTRIKLNVKINKDDLFKIKEKYS